MRLFWRPAAQEDRRHAYLYVAEHNFSAAEALEDRLTESARNLLDHPEQGRAGRIPNTREWVVTDTPYILIYEVGERLEILRVLHAAQQWPPPKN